MASGAMFGSRVSFRHVESPELVVLDDIDAPIPDVSGKFVKVSYQIPASQRHRFDGHSIRRDLEQAGARAVLLAPVLVPEVKRPETKRVAKGRKPREIVEAWFAEQVGASEEDKAAALRMVLGWMDSEGL